MFKRTARCKAREWVVKGEWPIARSSEWRNLPDDVEAFDMVEADESRSDPYDAVESRLDDVPHSEPSRLCGGVNKVGLHNRTPRRCKLLGLE
jgi:hypothetical protein